MKRILVVPLLSLMMLQLGAQNLGNNLDFSVNLKDLKNQYKVQNIIRAGKLVILDGVVRDINLTETGVHFILQDAEWNSKIDIRAYSAFLRLEGKKWIERFTVKQGQEPGLEHIPSGSRLLILSRITDWNQSLQMADAVAINLRILN